MDEHDGIEEVLPEKSSSDVPLLAGVTHTKIRVTYGSMWADLYFHYWWSEGGTGLNCYSSSYCTFDNGRRQGNISLSFSSPAGGSSWSKELTRGAVQDGQTHDLYDGSYIFVSVNSGRKATIGFNYTFDTSGGDPSAYGFLEVLYVPDPVITSPTNNGSVNRRFTAHGNNGQSLNLVAVKLYNAAGDLYLSDASVELNGNWSANIDFPAGSQLTFYAQQTVGNTSARSLPVTVSLAVADVSILSPKVNDVLRELNPEVFGLGEPGARIGIYESGSGAIEYGSTTVADSGWITRLSVPLPEREIVLIASQDIHGIRKWSNNVRVTVRIAPYPPVITTPAASSTQNPTFTLSGTGGEAGATMRVYLDLSQTLVGQAHVAGSAWSVPVNVQPGARSLVADQTLNGRPSGPSDHRTFNVRPLVVVLQQPTVAANNTVTFKGTGHVGADLDLHPSGDMNVLHTFKVTEAAWTKSFLNWLPGAYTIGGRQWVKGIGDQKIYSEWAEDVMFTVKVPLPTLTHGVDADQKPAFSGSGNVWDGHAPARVELQITGSSNPLPTMPIVNVVNNRWANTATIQWEPGTYSVAARQLFTPNGKPVLHSEWTQAQSVVIKAPLPSIDTITDNGLSPDFAGTCWKGAVVNLTFSDRATVYPVSDTDNDGYWTYRRLTPFTPGTYTVKATQTFGGQISNEVTRSFTVAVPKPVIKAMVPPVGHEPIIEGSGGYPGAEMTIYDYLTDQPLRQVPVTEDAWRVPLALEFRDYQIYARQSFNGVPSEKSELISFKAELLPPIVNTPQPVDTVARAFRIAGLASKKIGIEVASVEVWLEGGTEPWARIPVNYAGVFWFNATLPLGTHTLRFKQRITSAESAFGSNLVLGVVPAKPVIETPAEGEAIESRLAVSGFGYPGDTVSVAFADALDVILGTTQVEQNGTWSLWLSLDRPAGHPSLVVQQSFENHLSGWTTPRPVELRTQPPQFTTPLPGGWVEPKPTFAGTSWAGAKIELRDWSNPDISLTISHAVDDAWEATPTNDLRPNEHWVCATQSAQQSGGVTQVSASADSPRFEVMAVNDDPDSIP